MCVCVCLQTVAANVKSICFRNFKKFQTHYHIRLNIISENFFRIIIDTQHHTDYQLMHCPFAIFRMVSSLHIATHRMLFFFRISCCCQRLQHSRNIHTNWSAYAVVASTAEHWLAVRKKNNENEKQ